MTVHASQLPKLAALMLLVIATSSPGRVSAQELVDIGGFKLQVLRAGSGSPTVVFESGIGDFRGWSGIQPRVAEYTGTISYSHAGIGGSDAPGGPRSPENVARELRELLRRTGLQPPYILVGHSMGGLYARVFAMLYPSEIAGLVLVDGSHERQVAEFTRLDSSFLKTREAALRSLEPGQRAEMEGLANVLSTGNLGIPGKLPDVPMVVLTSTRSSPPSIQGAADAFRRMHDEIFRSTTYGMHIVTSRSSHFIQRDEPELVLNAIRWVFDAARTRR